MTIIYEQFITYLLKLEKQPDFFDKNPMLEKHHILPLHDGGKKTGAVVLCSPKNHTLAHYYRYLTYGQLGDKVAYQMRWNQKLGAKQRSLLAVKTNKQKGNIFWNPRWQSEQGKKGGKKGGSQNTKKQTLARSKVGNTYGSQTGIKNQRPLLKTMLSKTTVWQYDYYDEIQHKPAIKKLKITPQLSFSSLINILQLETVDSKTIIKKASFYKIIYGTRPQMYGWKLVFVYIN